MNEREMAIDVRVQRLEPGLLPGCRRMIGAYDDGDPASGGPMREPGENAIPLAGEGIALSVGLCARERQTGHSEEDENAACSTAKGRSPQANAVLQGRFQRVSTEQHSSTS